MGLAPSAMAEGLLACSSGLEYLIHWLAVNLEPQLRKHVSAVHYSNDSKCIKYTIQRCYSVVHATEINRLHLKP